MTTTPFGGPATFSKVVRIDGTFLTANVEMRLFAPGIYQGGVVFSDGATIALDLPPGVTFTSASGAFLTAPEPDVTLLGGASVAALIAIARRR